MEILQRGIVDHGQEVGQHAGLKTGGECADGAVGLAELRLAAQNVGADQGCDHVIGGIGSEENRAAIFFLDDGRLAKGATTVSSSFASVGEQLVVRWKLFGLATIQKGLRLRRMPSAACAELLS